ncbi:MAG: M23 family metallopeptidase [Gemmatimonadota bacterium]
MHTAVGPSSERARRASTHRLLVALLLATPWLVMPRPLDAQIASPLELRVPKPPTVATIDGQGVLVYELHITNFSPVAQNIRRIEVLDDATPAHVLLTLEDSALANAMQRPGVSPPPAAIDRARLAGGLRAVVYLWTPVSATAPPKRVSHRITDFEGSGDSAVTYTVVGGAAVVATSVATIAPPFHGGPWLAANGPGPVSGHRRALIPVDGTPAIGQRFAIDYVKLDTAGKTYKGDKLVNANYYAYGVEALAVADGIVAERKDSIPENIPGATSRAVPITLATIGGNHLILDIGGGRFAFYAHLQPGSLRVKVGDTVRKGQVIGLVGNSGNSTEPHLHFHISDAPSPLGSEGLPYVMESFKLVGRCKAAFLGCVAVPAETRRGEMPSGVMVIEVP